MIRYLLETSIIGSFLVLIILFLRFIFKNKIKKSIVYYLWIILIIKLLIPIGPESKLSIFNLANIKNLNYQTVNNVDINNNILSQNNESNEMNNVIQKENTSTNKEINKNSNIKINSNKETTELKKKNKNNLEKVLFLIWIIGTSIILLLKLMIYIRFKKSINNEYKNNLNYKYNIDISKELKLLNIKKNIKVIVTDKSITPSLIGIINPKILIPKIILKDTEENELRYIILHELCHYKRKDIFILWLSIFASSINWFNPIINLGMKIMKEDCELACDEMVLDNIEDSEKIYYGKTIINIIEAISIKNKMIGTTSIITSKKSIKERIKLIAKNKKFNFKNIILGIVIIIVFLGIALTNKVNTKKLNLIDYSKVNKIIINIMPSPPEAKVIDDKNNIKELVEYLNSIEVKNKKKVDIKGGEILSVNIEGEENYNIRISEDKYIYIDDIRYEVNDEDLNYIKKYAIEYESENKVYVNNVDDILEHLQKKYKIEIKSSKEKVCEIDSDDSAIEKVININNEEAYFYEFKNKESALAHIGVFNGDDYAIIDYAPYFLIDLDKLTNTKNLYFLDNIICLYDGESKEIKELLSNMLGEPLKRQSAPSLLISNADVTLIYPSQWKLEQDPKAIIIGEKKFDIDSTKVTLEKNICKVKINNYDLINELGDFDEEEIYTLWEHKYRENNKGFQINISRDDFIRLYKVKDSYINLNLTYKEIIFENDNKIEIAKRLFEEYLNDNKTDWFFNLVNGINEEPKDTFSDFKINDITLIEDGDNLFKVGISYDIKPLGEEVSIFDAGNGEREGEWIRKKYNFFDIEKIKGNTYRIINGYTG